MISLSNLKKQRLSSKSKEKLQPLMIGFDGDSQIDVAKSGLKKRFRILEEELRLTGFYTNYWMWNLVFLNVLIAFILGITVFFSYNSLPTDIGINVNNDANLDLIVDRQWLYLPVLLHILIPLGVIFIGLKSQKKLHHLYMVLFFQQFILAIFEFITIRNLLAYFVV